MKKSDPPIFIGRRIRTIASLVLRLSGKRFDGKIGKHNKQIGNIAEIVPYILGIVCCRVN